MADGVKGSLIMRREILVECALIKAAESCASASASIGPLAAVSCSATGAALFLSCFCSCLWVATPDTTASSWPTRVTALLTTVLRVSRVSPVDDIMAAAMLFASGSGEMQPALSWAAVPLDDYLVVGAPGCWKDGGAAIFLPWGFTTFRPPLHGSYNSRQASGLGHSRQSYAIHVTRPAWQPWQLPGCLKLASCPVPELPPSISIDVAASKTGTSSCPFLSKAGGRQQDNHATDRRIGASKRPRSWHTRSS